MDPTMITALNDLLADHGISYLAIFVAFFGFHYASKSNVTAEKTQTHQILTNMINRYRSEVMLLAIRKLWKFYNDTKNELWPDEDLNRKLSAIETKRLETKLWQNYDYFRKIDERKTENLTVEKQLAREKTTLHHYRRLVGGFYELLAGLYKEKVIRDKKLFRYWNKETLAIIPKIILPIERLLFEDLHPGTNEVPQIYTLMEDLHDDHPGEGIDWFWKHKCKRWFQKKIKWFQNYSPWLISFVKKILLR